MTNINYLVFIWNVFVDTLLLLIVYAWKMYDMQTLHGGGIPMFRGTYLVIHSDKVREFENGLVKSLCALLGCTKTRTSHYQPESDGMIERFNRTCLMMLSMLVNHRRDNWDELLPYVMHAYRTSVHESTGHSPFRLMKGEECSLPPNVSTSELRTNREYDISRHTLLRLGFMPGVHDALEVAYDHVQESLHRTATRRKRLYDVKAVNRKFPIGSWVLRFYPPAAQHKLGSPWIRPNQVVRQATGHTKGPGKAYNIWSCGRSETLPGPIGYCMESRHLDIKIVTRKYSGFPIGLSHKWDYIYTVGEYIGLGRYEHPPLQYTHSERIGHPYWSNWTYIVTFLYHGCSMDMPWLQQVYGNGRSTW